MLHITVIVLYRQLMTEDAPCILFLFASLVCFSINQCEFDFRLILWLRYQGYTIQGIFKGIFTAGDFMKKGILHA